MNHPAQDSCKTKLFQCLQERSQCPSCCEHIVTALWPQVSAGQAALDRSHPHTAALWICAQTLNSFGNFLLLNHILSCPSWLCLLFLALKAFVARRQYVLEADRRRDRMKEKGKKEMAVLLRGRKAESVKAERRTSYESVGTSATHTCSGHGGYSCVLCLFALCTHAWTHLPLPTNLCCVFVYCVCVWGRY